MIGSRGDPSGQRDWMQNTGSLGGSGGWSSGQPQVMGSRGSPLGQRDCIQILGSSGGH